MHVNSLQTLALAVSIPSMSSDQGSDESHFLDQGCTFPQLA